jgi:hypothetical protein
LLVLGVNGGYKNLTPSRRKAMAHCLMQEISYTKVGFYATVRDLGHTIMIFDVFTRLRLRLYCTHLNRDMTATVTATAI